MKGLVWKPISSNANSTILKNIDSTLHCSNDYLDTPESVRVELSQDDLNKLKMLRELISSTLKGAGVHTLEANIGDAFLLDEDDDPYVDMSVGDWYYNDAVIVIRMNYLYLRLYAKYTNDYFEFELEALE